MTSMRTRPWTGSRMTYSRLIGALFVAGFLSYGIGDGLVSSVTGSPNFLSTVGAHHTALVLGAFLMLLNTVVDVAKGVLFFPILEKHSKRTALAYLATLVVEVVVLAVGVLCLLMIVPLARQQVGAGSSAAGSARALGALAVGSNAMAYQIAEMSLGIGCIFLCALLFRTKLVPRFLSIAGLVGYPLLAAGAIAQIFGVRIGLVLSIPGGLFELTLGFWLIIKGFDHNAYDGRTKGVIAREMPPVVAETHLVSA
jgi:hypothetical protein